MKLPRIEEALALALLAYEVFLLIHKGGGKVVEGLQQHGFSIV